MPIDREIVGGCRVIKNRRAGKRQRKAASISLGQVERFLERKVCLPETLAGLELWGNVVEQVEVYRAAREEKVRVDLSATSPGCRNLATRLTYGGNVF